MSNPIPTPRNNLTKVVFTREQYEYLDRVFQEVTGQPKISDEELRWNCAVRSVVQHVRRLVHE